MRARMIATSNGVTARQYGSGDDVPEWLAISAVFATLGISVMGMPPFALIFIYVKCCLSACAAPVAAGRAANTSPVSAAGSFPEEAQQFGRGLVGEFFLKRVPAIEVTGAKTRAPSRG